MIERLNNCPNCDGILEDTGRCKFCGSKIYDFLNVNFSGLEAPSALTYIRIKANDKIILAPIVINNASLTVRPDDLYVDVFGQSVRYSQRHTPKMEIDLHLIVVGDMVQIDEEAIS